MKLHSSRARHDVPRRQWTRAVSLIAALGTLTPVVAAASAHFAAADEADPAMYPECQIQANPYYGLNQRDVQNDYIGPTGSVNRAAWEMNAPTFYGGGFYGQGVDVALIDSGVQPVPGLDGSNVVHGPDLSLEGQSPLAHLDTFGHGTHLAGIISGVDGPVPSKLEAGSPTTFAVLPYNWGMTEWKFRGVAPLSRTVSLKVADSTGATDVTQVIAAIDWAVRHRNDNGLNIRVINLSYGLTVDDDWRVDALSYAVDQAWKAGIVVVASTGNGGRLGAYGTTAKSTQANGLSSPAYNKNIIAVGAFDPGTGLADFSSTASAVNTRTPDVVAPGASIRSFFVPGSTAEEEISQDCANAKALGQAWTSPVNGDLRFVKGSGTSQAAAMVSGAVALMLSKDPTLTPDQVKFLLRGTATPIPGASGKNNQGEGKVNLDGLYKREGKNSMAQKNDKVVGGNNMDAARGYDPVTKTPNVLEASDKMVETKPGACAPDSTIPEACVPMTLTGDASIGGESFDLPKLQGAEGTGQAWCSNGLTPIGMCNDFISTGKGFPKPQATEVWRGGTFRVNTKFDNIKLLGNEQQERQLVIQSPAWTTAADWAGHAWTPHNWDGHKWAGHKWVTADWDGHKWAGHKWATDSWLSSNFDGHKWAGHKWEGHKWAGQAWVDFTWS